MRAYLQATEIIDYNDKSIQDYIQQFDRNKTQKQQAVDLFYAVRDGFPYYPYYIDFTIKGSKASNLIQKKKGHCIDKAIFMIACSRALGIPARLGLAKVKNHIATEKLELYLQSNIMVPHGYVEIYLSEKWIKITPAFNAALCEHLSVKPLEFDGKSDCLFQEYDAKGNTFMEYLEDYGTFEDVPLPFIRSLFKEYYPHLSKTGETDHSFIQIKV